MFDMSAMSNLWQMLSQGAQSPDPTAAAASLAQLGDPDAVMAPLFKDTKSWSPTYMGEGFDAPSPTGPLAGVGQSGAADPMITFDKMLTPQAPVQVPQVNLGNSAYNMDGTARVRSPDFGASTQPNNALSTQQMQQLLGAMPDAKGGPQLPPPASPGRPSPFNAQMSTMAAPSPNMARRLTLADLIYGGGR